MLSNRSNMGSNRFACHLIGHSSKVIPRVCRSTIQAEAYEVTYGVEAGDAIRAAIADVHGQLERGSRWESSAAAFMPQIWFTDCENVVSACMRPTAAKLTDKRLCLDIAGMRQSLWRRPGESVGNPHIDDDMPKESTDVLRWVDTDVMLADAMTKVMEPIKLPAPG